MAHKLLGKNFMPHDVVAKVTGEAKYAEDFRAEGMVFARLLSSPYPHARVQASIDVSEALKMPGVVGILTADDVKNPAAPDIPLLTKEPGYVGAPILLLAAEDETTAQDAIEKIRIDFEPLPFHVDPLAEPASRTARCAHRRQRRRGRRRSSQTLKWTREDFDDAGRPHADGQGRRRNGPSATSTPASRAASWCSTKRFVHASNSHHSMEPRTAMAYWQNGKCIAARVDAEPVPSSSPALAGMIGIQPTTWCSSPSTAAAASAPRAAPIRCRRCRRCCRRRSAAR